MKKNLLIMSLAALMSLSLVACNENKPSTNPSNEPSVNDSTTPSEETKSETPSETTSEAPSENVSSPSTNSNPNTEVYGVVVIPTQHITITPSVNVAHPGDTITLEVTIDSGYLLEGIYVNNVLLTGKEFTMPNTSALITSKVQMLSNDGMFLGGDISEPLVLNNETGIWEAKDVKISIDSNVYYSINGKTLGAVEINNEKCFADLSIPGSSKTKGFGVAGGATYNFYYDPSNATTPCYVVRTKVDALPNSIDTLRTLFDGFVKSESTEYPSNVNHVEFSSTKDNESYAWDLYENGSYASVKKLSPVKTKAIVYKSIENGVYTVVDNYTEGESSQDMSTKSDTRKYSAHYDMVQALDPIVGAKHYQMLEEEALKDSKRYSHNYDSLQYDIEYAYSWGHGNDVADDVYDWDVSIQSTANDDGTFTTEVNSWTSVVANGAVSVVDANHHNVYEMTINFKNDGSLLDLTYYEAVYNDKQFDFSPITSGGHGKFLPGGEDDPADEYQITCSYGYGDPKVGAPQQDVSKYFVQEINAFNITSSSGVPNALNRLDKLTQATGYYESELTNLVELQCEPSTALDAWQYGINSSSNTDVISRTGQLNDLWTAVGSGESTLTIGNRTKSTGVTATFKAVVPENLGDIKSVWCYTVYPYQNDKFGAGSGTVAAGTKEKVKLCASLINNSQDQHPDVKVTANSPLVNVSYDQESGYLTIDATPAKGITEKKTVILTVEANYADGWGPSQIYVYITPTAKIFDTVVGEWMYAFDEGQSEESTGYKARINLTDTDVEIEGTTYKQGTVHVESKETTNIYDVSFAYIFDAASQTFTEVKVISASMNGETVSSCKFLLAIDNVNGYLDAYAEVTTDYKYDEDSGEYVPNDLIFIGSYEEQEEADTLYYYDPFEPVK